MTETLRRRAARWCATAFALFQLVVPVWVPLYDMQLRALHVTLVVAAILLIAPLFGERRGALSLVIDGLLIAIAAVANLIVFLNWEEIATFTSSAETIDLLLGAVLMLTVLDAARRAAGLAIPLFVLAIFAYVFVGPWMPGIWTHPGFPLSYVVESLYYSTSGLYGSLTGTSATFIAMFILFGSLLQATGGGQTFMDLALLIAGRSTGGPAKVGVVASALFGMISGSAVANVSVTGNYTIPLMRRLGYERNFAAGVEAMSSTGGGITPPVMGITAFIMADILNIPYLQVIGYAAIPCLLFYTGILAGVHFKARRSGLAPAPASELPRARDVLTWSRLTPLFLPVGILLFLLFRGANLTAAGFWACIAVVVLFLFADFRPAGVRERARRLVAAFGDGGEAIARIAPVLIAVSLFTSLLGLTGVAPKVSGLILDMGGETLIASLAVAAIIPLVLGAPLPVTATYILSAALIAPALIRLQLDQVSVHMFLLYWATLASVTPPTCTACVIGASIAGGNWFRTSLVAMRLGIVAFLMPFFFVLNPALIARGPLFDVVTATASGLAGAILLAAGFFGYLTSPLNLAVRGIYLVAGCLLLAPDNRLFLAGIAIALAGYGLEFFSARRRAGRPLP